MVSFWEALVRRIPVVRNIYQALKQFTEAIFLNSGGHFKQVVMLEFPREGSIFHRILRRPGPG